MDMTDTIALASAIGTGVGALIAVPSVLYARRAAKAGESSAASGKDSAAAARASAEASRRSAEEAARLTAIEADRRKEEKERWHHERGPTPPAEIELTLSRDPGSASEGALFATITVPHGYRVRGFAIYDNGNQTDTGLESTLKPNQPQTFFVEHWSPGQKHPRTAKLWIRFWPPLEPDGLEVWECPCGRPTGESLDGEGHWEWRVPIRYDRPRVRSMGL